MTCLPKSGGCERPFTDAFVAHLNSLEGTRYSHRSTLMFSIPRRHSPGRNMWMTNVDSCTIYFSRPNKKMNENRRMPPIRPARSKPKGHHFIPRFLLNGFASRSGEGQRHVWVFHKSRSPVESNTRDVAKQKFFHGDPSNSPLEYAVAKAETSLAELVQRLRSGNANREDFKTVPELVVHLWVRTKNIRDGFAVTCRGLLDLLQEMLEECKRDDSLRRAMEALLVPAIENELRAPQTEAFMGLGPVQRLRIRMGMRRMIARGRLPTELLPYLQSQRHLLDTSVDDAGRNAQLSSLSKELAPCARVEELSLLHWGVVPARGARLVLGDVVVIAETERRSEYVNLTAADDNFPLVGVVLPLTPESALVGSRGAITSIEARKINEASAALSRDFFVASQRTTAEERLLRVLGTRADLFTKEQIWK